MWFMYERTGTICNRKPVQGQDMLPVPPPKCTSVADAINLFQMEKLSRGALDRPCIKMYAVKLTLTGNAVQFQHLEDG